MASPAPGCGVRAYAPVLAALFLALALQHAMALPLSTGPLKAHNPVVIEGDADWCDRPNAQGIDDDGVDCIAGDGSSGEPYVIRNWKFNLAAYPPGTAAITIRNTTRFWLIENNLFTDTREERLRDGLMLVGASDDHGRVEHNRFEHLRTAITAREWFASTPCTLAQGQMGQCMWRRISAPGIEGNVFRANDVAVVNGPNLGFPYNTAASDMAQNNFEHMRDLAYAEILPTKWRPSLVLNWWGSPMGPGNDVQGGTAGGGRIRAQCVEETQLPVTGQPRCVTPWLPAPNPTAGPLALWGS